MQRVKGKQIISALLKYGVPLIITVGLCVLLFRGFDFEQMLEIIRRDCNFWWIGLALAISVLSHVVRAARWQIQLRALGVNCSLWELTLSIFGTYAVNLVFPRLGEVWRTGWVAGRKDAPFTTVFGSMVADRLADTVTVALLTVVTFILAGTQMKIYLAENPEAYQGIINTVTSPWIWGCGLALIAVIWVIFVRMPNNKFVAKAREIWHGLWQGFAVIGRMPGRGKWLLLVLGTWFCYFMQLYVAFFAFPLTTDVVARFGVLAVLVCFVLSSISMGVPSNGGIGPWQWAIVFGLSLYSAAIPGLTQEYATSFANLVMGMQTLMLVFLGLFTFIVIALQKKAVKKAAQG